MAAPPVDLGELKSLAVGAVAMADDRTVPARLRVGARWLAIEATAFMVRLAKAGRAMR